MRSTGQSDVTDLNVTATIQSVTANFAIDTFTLTLFSGNQRKHYWNPPQAVDYGTSGTAVTAVANPGLPLRKLVRHSSGTDNPRDGP